MSRSRPDKTCPSQRKHLGLSPPWDTAAAPAATAEQVTESDREELVIGIAAAASYLGYVKPDSFRRARTRHPIPGETRTGDGRPAWPADSLQAWRTSQGRGDA
jgi:hypothetical protein